MALFPVLKFEEIVAVDDKTRLDARDSYANGGDAITQLEIDPGTGTYIDVTSAKYIDTQFPSAGDKTINVRINGTEVKSFTLPVISIADDKLFSNDADLETHEPDILKYVKAGRNSFKDVHRRAQTIILDWLDKNRVWKKQDARYTKDDLVDVQDFVEWSTFLTLQLIFEGLSDKNDDKWKAKADKYKADALDARERGTYRLDYNEDGTLTLGEKVDNWSKELIRQ